MGRRAFWYPIFVFVLLPVISSSQSSWEDKNRAGEKAFTEGKLSDANRFLNEALKDAQQFGPKDVRLAPIFNNLALVAFVQNNFIASESLYQKAIDLIEASGGPDNPLLLPVLENLTRLYVKQWAFEKAIQTSWRVCHIREKKLGVENPETVASLGKLAKLYVDSVSLLPHATTSDSGSKSANYSENEKATDDLSRLAMAESLYRRVLAVQETMVGVEGSRLVDVLDNLGEVLHVEGNLEQAQQSYGRAIKIIEKSFGLEDLKLVEPLRQMAELKLEDGVYSDAEGLYQRALRIDEAKLGPKDSSLAILLTGYSALLEKMQKSEEAKRIADRAASLSTSKPGSSLNAASQVASVPYVLRFERSVYDRYSGIHQTCMLIRADGRFRVEDQQRQGTPGDPPVVPKRQSPDVMSIPTDAQNTLDIGGGAGARLPSVFENSVDGSAIQQLLAILSARDIREIHGDYPPKKAASNYYGNEKIMLSILRDDDVQSFAFPDVNTRQPFEGGLKPLLKWLNSTEKHKGAAIKGSLPNNCSPDMPQAGPMQLTAKLGAAPKTVPKNIESQGNVPTFKVNVNLVLVRVVVRDARGHAVGSLHQDDFRLLDNRTQQTISRFSLERTSTYSESSQAPETTRNSEGRDGRRPTSAPRNFAFLFDDIHLNQAELDRARNAADHHLSSLPMTDRVAIFTTSGQTTHDFTTDLTKLHEALGQIRARKNSNAGGNDCPQVDAYMADLIYNKNDEDALGAATGEALVCAFGNDVRAGAAAETMAKTVAQQQVAAADIQSRLVLRALETTLQRLASTTGQHTVVLVSSGFVAPGREQDFGQMIDRALHSDIIINALDARGLYNIDSVDNRSRANLDYRRDSAAANAVLLTTLTDATGGTFFHNSNDLEEGFLRIMESPEYYYVLGFTPGNQELDGRFHSLSVVLNNGSKTTVQARKGYYAAKRDAR